MKFPQGFLWGAATAAHQVEGGNINSDAWLLEHVEGTVYSEPSGDACDHYHRYREDIALLAGLGFNAYRFSIEWARIEPEEGEFSLAQLEHYRRMLAACHEHAVKPVVTLHHLRRRDGLRHAADGSQRTRRSCSHATVSESQGISAIYSPSYALSTNSTSELFCNSPVSSIATTLSLDPVGGAQRPV